VRAEATFVSAVLSEPGAAETMLRNMLADQAFTQRVFGLAILPMVVQPDKQKQLAAPLAKDDPDPIIKQLAASMVEVADLPRPATQPATQESADGK
jgi:hypothetical protein